MLQDHFRNKAKKITYQKICGGLSGWETWYAVYDRECADTYAALYSMCRLIDADPEAVIAVEKAIRRNTQYQHAWNHEATLSYRDAGSEDSYRRCVAATDNSRNCYKSTGRRWNF